MEGGKEEARGGWEGGNNGREGGEGEGGGGNEGGREVKEGGMVGTREGGREGSREEAMMLCRERVSVEEERVGRVDEGNERGRDGTGMDGVRERWEGVSEQRMD